MVYIPSQINLSSAFAFVGHVAFRASSSEKMQRSLQLPLEPLVILNVRFIFLFIFVFIFIFILTSIFTLIFIEASGNHQCQIHVKPQALLASSIEYALAGTVFSFWACKLSSSTNASQDFSPTSAYHGLRLQ